MSYDDRFLVQISSWDWALHVGMAADHVPPEMRFQGGLLHSRGLYVEGTVLAPPEHRGKSIFLSLIVFGPDAEFGPGGLRDVGQLHEERGTARKADFSAILLMPQDALPGAMTCLASVWRFIDLWTGGDPSERASITDFAFGRTVHKRAYPGLPDTGDGFVEATGA